MKTTKKQFNFDNKKRLPLYLIEISLTSTLWLFATKVFEHVYNENYASAQFTNNILLSLTMALATLLAYQKIYHRKTLSSTSPRKNSLTLLAYIGLLTGFTISIGFSYHLANSFNLHFELMPFLTCTTFASVVYNLIEWKTHREKLNTSSMKDHY